MGTAVIKKFETERHKKGLIALWNHVFGYGLPHHDPELNIDKKLAMDDSICVAENDGEVVGSIMFGYDGHRGWIYLLAVDPQYRNQKIGTALLAKAEACLLEAGCLKINLQIVEGNGSVEAFYRKQGYSIEPRISMGKKLPIQGSETV